MDVSECHFYSDSEDKTVAIISNDSESTLVSTIKGDLRPHFWAKCSQITSNEKYTYCKTSHFINIKHKYAIETSRASGHGMVD